jgi:hypothetical protein
MRYFNILCIGLCVVCVALQSPLQAWYTENHQRIARAGLAQLPTADREMLGASLDSLANAYCMYPDWYRDVVRKKNKAMIAHYKPYVQLPLLEDLVSWHITEDTDSETCFYIVSTLMQRAVTHLQVGDTDQAAQYMGSLVHFIEDNACPVHVIDNKLLADLHPIPERLKPFILHRQVEEPTFPIDIRGYTPQILGTTIIDAAHAVYPRFRSNRKNARNQAAPILEAIYADNRTVADQYRAQAAIPAAQLLADVVHTICVLASR